MSILKEYLGIFSDKYLTMPKIYASDIVEIFIIAVLVFAFGAFFIDVYYNWPAFIIEEPAIEITETTDNLN